MTYICLVVLQVREQYQAVGRLLGACLWHGKPLGVTFATAFCRQVLSAAASVELVVKTAKEPKPSQDDDDDDLGSEAKNNETEIAGNGSSGGLGQFPASLGGGCLGYGAAWRVARKPPAPRAAHPATAATVAACSRIGSSNASSESRSAAAASSKSSKSSSSSSSSSTNERPADDAPSRRSKRLRPNQSNLLASAEEEPPQVAAASNTGPSKRGAPVDGSSEGTGKSIDGLASSATMVDEISLPSSSSSSSSSPWVLIGGAKMACSEGECVLPATMLQCLGLRDGDMVVVTAPARARNRAGRLLHGPPGDRDLWLAAATPSGASAAEPGPISSATAANLTAAFQRDACCGWVDSSTMGLVGSSTACRRGNSCADCKATPFPVRDQSTGRARCPVVYGNFGSGSSSTDLSAVAASVSWAVVPRLKGQRPTKRRQVVPRNGMAEAHDLTFLLALTHDIDAGGNRNAAGFIGGHGGGGGDDEFSDNGTVRAEIARALGIDNAINRSDSSSRSSNTLGANAGESNHEKRGKSSSLLRLLASTGSLNAPCVAKGARFGFRWCDADLELVVTEVRWSVLVVENFVKISLYIEERLRHQIRESFS